MVMAGPPPGGRTVMGFDGRRWSALSGLVVGGVVVDVRLAMGGGDGARGLLRDGEGGGFGFGFSFGFSFSFSFGALDGVWRLGTVGFLVVADRFVSTRLPPQHSQARNVSFSFVNVQMAQDQPMVVLK